jgi:hypothetical protein
VDVFTVAAPDFLALIRQFIIVAVCSLPHRPDHGAGSDATFRHCSGFTVSQSDSKQVAYWEATAIGVGGMVGGGIFAVLGLSV